MENKTGNCNVETIYLKSNLVFCFSQELVFTADVQQALLGLS
jgi:hypothetical protein